MWEVATQRAGIMLGHQIESDDHREITIDLITEATHSARRRTKTTYTTHKYAQIYTFYPIGWKL